MERVWMFLQKIKNRTTIWPKTYISRYLPKENKKTTLKRHMHLYVHCIIIYNRQDVEIKMFTDGWIDKGYVVCNTQWNIIQSQKE